MALISNWVDASSNNEASGSFLKSSPSLVQLNDSFKTVVFQKYSSRSRIFSTGFSGQAVSKRYKFVYTPSLKQQLCHIFPFIYYLCRALHFVTQRIREQPIRYVQEASRC